MMHLKVCGLTKLQQVVPLQPWGVTHAGFIFYPASPRYVLDHLSISEIRSINTVSKVGVFVNASESEVMQTTEACGLQMVQLHGEEGPDYCRRVGAHIPVMKAFRLDGTETLSSLLAPYEGVCAMFLFDTKGLAYGGTGHKFKWEILNTYNIETPFFLSGGIGPEDAEDILSLSSSPQMKAMIGVDVNSRFETSPGIKDLPAVERFAFQLRESKNDNGNYSNVHI